MEKDSNEKKTDDSPEKKNKGDKDKGEKDSNNGKDDDIANGKDDETKYTGRRIKHLDHSSGFLPIYTTAEITLLLQDNVKFERVHCVKSGWPELDISPAA